MWKLCGGSGRDFSDKHVIVGATSSQAAPDIHLTSDYDDRKVLSPGETVRTLLESVRDAAHEPKEVFCQLDLLFHFHHERQWREYARWVKFEEDVEEGGERWSKPHVATLSLHSLFELRSTLLNGAMLLDLDAQNMPQLVSMFLEHVIEKNMLDAYEKPEIRFVLMSPHIHAHQKRQRSHRPVNSSFSFIKALHGSEIFSKRSSKAHILDAGKVDHKKHPHQAEHLIGSKPNSKTDLPRSDSRKSYTHMNTDEEEEEPSPLKLNVDFMRKVPDDAEVCNIMVGEVGCLKRHLAAFIRLPEARTLGDLTEVPLPTRFVFIMLGPAGSAHKCIEIGRAMSTVMVDEIFREVAFKARNRQDIVMGLDEFMDQLTVLPPCQWDTKIRIDPPAKIPPQNYRIMGNEEVEHGPHHARSVAVAAITKQSPHADPSLVRTGRLFGGLISDIRRKAPWYFSDFKDALHVQCFASIFFLFLATLTPNVTFGALMGQATENYMGTMECLLAAAIVSSLYALFSGQPLTIMGTTGPMLVLEGILFSWCKEYDWDFLPFRCWIGLWTALMLLVFVALDLSALVRYVTRFTEEGFACLIALIFFYEAVKKQISISGKYGINPNPEEPVSTNCTCFPPDLTTTVAPNLTIFSSNATFATTTLPSVTNAFDASNLTMSNWTSFDNEACKKYGGTLVGDGCQDSNYYPDVFFLSCIVFMWTFVIAVGLKKFKTAPYFPTFVRQRVSDFAVLIAIISMVSLDALFGLKTPKLHVPDTFQPTRFKDRGWFVNPISPKNPWWTIFGSIVPALLALILVFMDQQITAVIINRKENKLKKGGGYHLDLLVVAVCIAMCSLLGLPWFVAATIRSITHMVSLKKESETAAPGEKPTFLGCREQRVTTLLVGILNGCAVLFTPILKHVPMSVLYGVFLYMGYAAFDGMQFIDRIMLLIMPTKYQPDHTYLRHVQTHRVHIFTGIQIGCLAVLWVVKTIKSVSIIFPAMVVAICFVRKLLDKFFTQYELRYLDDLMPEEDKKKKDETECVKHLERNLSCASFGDQFIDQNFNEGGDTADMEWENMHHDKHGYLPTAHADRVNITEQINTTGIWMHVRKDCDPAAEVHAEESSTPPTKLSKRSKKKKKEEGEEEKQFYLGDDPDAIPEVDESQI